MEGKIKIRKANENQGPAIVYVRHFGQIGFWVCEVLNEGTTLFSNDEDLIDFDFNEFERLKLEWNITKAERTLKRLKEKRDASH